MSTCPIQKILIANRGEIARRVMRTCREMGIATVAVFSDADRAAPFVREADEAVALGGNSPAESYLRIEKILAAARQTGSDAVHPGYGFLSENADFAQACSAEGITYIGPPAAVIAAMGSKIEAKKRMQRADVPVLPTLEVGDQSSARVLSQLESWAWPLLIKASAGGGGRGMRIARSASEFPELLELARSETKAAFGDGTLFVEPYVEAPRHVEVQILGDTHGEIVHLFERECSIQRRHQKLIEESPSLALDEELRRAMTAAALRVAREIGYVNAGTVEFLLTPDRQFYFLEVNTRLQVEHPVTECVTGLDLVRLQILIAKGEPLPPEARIDTPRGHAIEARLCAEDPRQGYLPVAGTLDRFRLPTEAGVRVESALDDGGVVSPYYDSLLAKVIVHAPTRGEAARRLARALRKAEIHGLRTNRELLVRTLEHPEFLDGRTDTHFLERHDAVALAAPLGDLSAERVHAAAAALAAQAERRSGAAVLSAVPSGWRNNASQLQRIVFRGAEKEILVEYQFHRDGLQLRIDGEPVGSASCWLIASEQIWIELAGVGRICNVHRVGQAHYVDSALGASALIELPRFPSPVAQAAAGSLMAPLPGVIHEVCVHVGDAVGAGDVLLIIDSMKVLHRVSAPRAGRVAELRVEAGSHVDAGLLLAVIEDAEVAR